MAYTPNTWTAREGTGLNRYVDNDGNYHYLTPAPESVVVPGTPFSADWMNHIETGIKALSDTLDALAMSTGSWTPSFGYSDGTHGGGTYGTQTGGYVKIGKLVLVWYRLGITPTATWSNTGQLNILGLPFSVAETIYSMPVTYSGLNGVGSSVEIMQYGSTGNSRIQLMSNTLGGAYDATPGTVLNTTSAKNMNGAFIYMTND